MAWVSSSFDADLLAFATFRLTMDKTMLEVVSALAATMSMVVYPLRALMSTFMKGFDFESVPVSENDHPSGGV